MSFSIHYLLLRTQNGKISLQFSSLFLPFSFFTPQIHVSFSVSHKKKSDLFEQVVAECSQHHLELQSLIRKMQEEGLDVQTARNADHYGALIHHLSLVRNKRCLMAYVNNRAEIIRSLLWKIGSVLPKEIEEKLSHTEEEYFNKYSGELKKYMSKMELDLTVDMVPPKDPYIKVRVLDDIGDGIVLSDKTANFARHSIHFLKRTDAEQFISRGLMEELTG